MGGSLGRKEGPQSKVKQARVKAGYRKEQSGLKAAEVRDG